MPLQYFCLQHVIGMVCFKASVIKMEGKDGKHTTVTDHKSYFHLASMQLNYLEGEFVLPHDFCLKSAA